MDKTTVLVVEDSDTLRYLTVQQLSASGVPADTANSGQEALRKFASGSYALILMDIMMPDVSGLDATRAIRKMEQKQGSTHVPIIAMTAYRESSECLEAGMDDYLCKPVKLDDLRQKLSQWLPHALFPQLKQQQLLSADSQLQTKPVDKSISEKINELKRKYKLDQS